MGPTMGTGSRLAPALQGANRLNAANSIAPTGGRLGSQSPKPILPPPAASGGGLGVFGTVATFLGGFAVTTGILGVVDMNAQQSSAQEFKNNTSVAPGEVAPEILAKRKKPKPNLKPNNAQGNRSPVPVIVNITPTASSSQPALSEAQQQFQKQMQLQQVAFDVQNFNFSQSNIASNAYIAALTHPVTILGKSDEAIEVLPLKGDNKYKNGETYNAALNRTFVKQQQAAQEANRNSRTSQMVVFQRPIPGSAIALSRFTGNKTQLTHLLNNHFITQQDLQKSGVDLNRLSSSSRQQQNEPPTEKRQPEIGLPSRPIHLPKQRPQERAKGDVAQTTPVLPKTSPTGDSPKNAKPGAVEIEPSSTPVEFPRKENVPHFPNSKEQQSTVYTISPVEHPLQTYPLEIPAPENKVNPNNPLEITGIFGGRGSQRGRGADGEKTQAQKDLEARMAQSEAEHAERLRQAQAAENDPNTEVGRRKQQIREEAQQKATQAYLETGKAQDVNDFIDQPSDRGELIKGGSRTVHKNQQGYEKTGRGVEHDVRIAKDLAKDSSLKDLVPKVVSQRGQNSAVFEDVGGQSLRQYLRSNNLSDAELSKIEQEVFQVKARLAAKGYVFTDSHSNNIQVIIAPNGQRQYKLTDLESVEQVGTRTATQELTNRHDLINNEIKTHGKVGQKENPPKSRQEPQRTQSQAASNVPQNQPSHHLSAKEQKRLNELENRTGFLNGRTIWEDQELEKLREKATQRPAQPDNSTSTPSSSDSSPPSNNSENLTPREQRELEKLENPGWFGRDMWEDRRLNELRQKRDGG